MEESVWKEARSRTIGGSEVSAVLGVNPYVSPHALWLRKTNRLPPVQENKYMRAGKLMEPVIVALWQHETSYEILDGSEENMLYYHPEYSFISGTPDRFYKTEQNETGVIELKNTRMSVDAQNFPQHWWCQLQYYMGLTGKSKGEIAWLYQGVDLFHQSFEFSPIFWQYAIEQVVHFWREYVEKDTPPPAFKQDLDHLFSHHIVGKSVIATEDTLQLMQKIHNIRTKKCSLLEQESNGVDQIKLIMQDSEFLLSPTNEVLATWKTNKANKRILLIKY